MFLEVPVSVETDFARYMSERSDLLHRRLDEVHRLIDTGELNTVEITRDGFSIKPYRGALIPDAATAFVDLVNAAMPRIKITDLLVGYFRTTPRKGAFQPSYQEIIREHQPGGPGLRS